MHFASSSQRLPLYTGVARSQARNELHLSKPRIPPLAPCASTILSPQRRRYRSSCDPARSRPGPVSRSGRSRAPPPSPALALRAAAAPAPPARAAPAPPAPGSARSALASVAARSPATSAAPVRAIRLSARIHQHPAAQHTSSGARLSLIGCTRVSIYVHLCTARAGRQTHAVRRVALRANAWQATTPPQRQVGRAAVQRRQGALSWRALTCGSVRRALAHPSRQRRSGLRGARRRVQRRSGALRGHARDVRRPRAGCGARVCAGRRAARAARGGQLRRGCRQPLLGLCAGCRSMTGASGAGRRGKGVTSSHAQRNSVWCMYTRHTDYQPRKCCWRHCNHCGARLAGPGVCVGHRAAQLRSAPLLLGLRGLPARLEVRFRLRARRCEVVPCRRAACACSHSSVLRRRVLTESAQVRTVTAATALRDHAPRTDAIRPLHAASAALSAVSPLSTWQQVTRWLPPLPGHSTRLPGNRQVRQPPHLLLQLLQGNLSHLPRVLVACGTCSRGVRHARIFGSAGLPAEPRLLRQALTLHASHRAQARLAKWPALCARRPGGTPTCTPRRGGRR